MAYHSDVANVTVKMYWSFVLQGNLSVCVILAEEDRNVSYIVATNPESNIIPI